MNAVTGAIGRTDPRSERAFFLWSALALAAVVFVGFARSFFLRPLFPDWPAPHEAFFYVHGTVFATWYTLLCVQATLITTGRVGLHRRVGVAGAFLAAAMVLLGTFGGLLAAHRPGGFVGLPIPPLSFLIVPLSEMALFAVLVALAIAMRRKPTTHKRLMLIASASLTAAAFARWPVVGAGGPLAFFGAADLFVVALVVFDLRVLGRVHPATAWAGGASIAIQPLSLVLAGTSAWLGFAHWAVGFLD
jgi:uncharacterized membrane protein YozB (DUF420 family)